MRYDRDFAERDREYEYHRAVSPGEYNEGEYDSGFETAEDLGYDTGFGGPVDRRGELVGRGEYGRAYEAPYGGEWEERGGGRSRGERRPPGRGTGGRFHGYGMGYGGGALRSRGSFQAGQLRSGLNPEDDLEFEWGEGYVGGRGCAGTNYDLRHGYRVGSPREELRRGWRAPHEEGGPELQPGPGAGGQEWGAERARSGAHFGFGPGRYGYGPYHERLRRRRLPDDEIREAVEETLFYDTWVDADRIEVSVEDGVVTLRGTLPSYDEVRYATDDAWEVDGVRGVRSELSVSGMAEAAKGPDDSRDGGTDGG